MTAGLKILDDCKVPYKISFGDNCHPEAQIAKVENYLREISDVTSVDEATLKELCKFADIDFYESVISTLITGEFETSNLKQPRLFGRGFGYGYLLKN